MYFSINGLIIYFLITSQKSTNRFFNGILQTRGPYGATNDKLSGGGSGLWYIFANKGNNKKMLATQSTIVYDDCVDIPGLGGVQPMKISKIDDFDEGGVPKVQKKEKVVGSGNGINGNGFI